jgi:RimJ/RimL family protein N-acetyltransferase
MKTLEGKLVRLRAIRNEDIDEMLEMFSDFETVRQFVFPGPPFPPTKKDEQTFIDGNSMMRETYNFAIETLDGVYIGGCGIPKIGWVSRVAMVGIWIGREEFQGKGYGTDAMRILCQFLFQQINIRKIALTVYGFNERAIHSYEKIGFQTEGRLRDAMYRNGAYHDVVWMGMFEEEFIGLVGEKS